MNFIEVGTNTAAKVFFFNLKGCSVINTNVCLYFNLEALGSLNCSPGIKNAKVVKYAQEEFEDTKGR
jgi:hypothetical protein